MTTRLSFFLSLSLSWQEKAAGKRQAISMTTASATAAATLRQPLPPPLNCHLSL